MQHFLMALLTDPWGIPAPAVPALWPPRLSMARPIRASGDLNPNATGMISLIWVFMDSIRPLESPCSIDVRIASRCLTMDLCSFTKDSYSIFEPGIPRAIQGLAGLLMGKHEARAQPFFEVVGPAQGRIGLDDPAEFDLLFFGEVFRVLPQRVAAVLQFRGPAAVGWRWGVLGRSAARPGRLVLPSVLPCPVPKRTPFGIEGIGGSFLDVERVRDPHGVGAAVGHDGGDPLGGVGGNMRDSGAAPFSERVEEFAQSGLVPSGGSPDEQA